MFARFLCRIVRSDRVGLQALGRRLVAMTRTAAPTLFAGARAALTRSKPHLVAENALLRQQLLIRELAATNQLWGAERIRGELLKRGIRIAKTTVQRHMREARPPRRDGQTWAAFLCNHAPAIWGCDFMPVTDLRFRPLHACFVLAHGSRRVVHVGVTRPRSR